MRRSFGLSRFPAESTLEDYSLFFEPKVALDSLGLLVSAQMNCVVGGSL